MIIEGFLLGLVIKIFYKRGGRRVFLVHFLHKLYILFTLFHLSFHLAPFFLTYNFSLYLPLNLKNRFSSCKAISKFYFRGLLNLV